MCISAANLSPDMESGYSHLGSSGHSVQRLSPLSSGPWCQFLVSVVTLASMALIVFEFRDTVYHVLFWIEKQDTWITCIMFAGLFTVVSLPLTWGYILLNLACGYLFGILPGIFVVMTTAAIGVLVAHLVVKQFCLSFIAARVLNSQSLRAFVYVISGPQAFKVVAFARLTPIPFGLQNAIFAVSPLSDLISCYLFFPSAILLSLSDSTWCRRPRKSPINFYRPCAAFDRVILASKAINDDGMDANKLDSFRGSSPLEQFTTGTWRTEW